MFSARMLREHLSQSHDAASRRTLYIDAHVDLIHTKLLHGATLLILDLACGPGLYLERLARKGYSVRGIDFSPASVVHARETTLSQGLAIEVIEGDLLETPFGGPHDLVMLLSGEINVFRPEHAALILQRAAESLTSGGRLLLEASTYDSVKAKACPPTWYAAAAGLWSDRPHVVLQESAWDEASESSTIRYFVIDVDSSEGAVHAVTYRAHTLDALPRSAASGRLLCNRYRHRMGRRHGRCWDDDDRCDARRLDRRLRYNRSMIRLRNKETSTVLGSISEEELQFLQDQLEEESSEDTDYYIGRDELEILKENGPPGLVRMLEEALGDREGIEIEWVEE